MTTRIEPYTHANDSIRRWRWIVTALFVLVAWPADAMATTLGNVVCNLKSNLGPFAPMMSTLAYIGGALLVARSAYLFVKHFDNPNDSKTTAAIVHFLVGGAMVSLPAFMGAVQRTLFHGNLGAASSGGCTAGTVGGSADLSQLMVNFVGNIYGPMFAILTALMYLVGTYFIYRGLAKSAKIGTDPRASAPQGIIALLLIGAVLISGGTMVTGMINSLGIQSLFGSPSGVMDNMRHFSGINWSRVTTTTNTEAVDHAIQACLAFVQIIGLIGFIRGWMILRGAVEGTSQATVPQGLTHIIGGTMAMNMGTMLKILDNTFGMSLIN